MAPDSGSSSPDGRLLRLEQTVHDLQALVSALQTRLETESERLKQIESVAIQAQNRYRIACPACHTAYDMLTQHYSIGLFDNLVYVKCPKCQKSLPLQSDGRGGVRAVTD